MSTVDVKKLDGSLDTDNTYFFVGKVPSIFIGIKFT